MARRTKLLNVPRLEVPSAGCVVKPCDVTPRPGELVCWLHARALAALTQRENAK